MTYDLWTEASVDVEAEHAAGRLTRAKVSVASLWPFLSMARTSGEFEHRLALTAERIETRVDGDLLDPVLASLRADFALVATKDAEGEEDASDEDDDSDGKPDWLKEKIKSKGRLEFFHAGLGRWVAVEDDATAGKGNPYYFTGGPEGGPNTGQTNQYPPHPTGQDPWSPINDMFPMDPTPWVGGPEWTETPMQFTPPGGPNAQRTAANDLPPDHPAHTHSPGDRYQVREHDDKGRVFMEQGNTYGYVTHDPHKAYDYWKGNTDRQNESWAERDSREFEPVQRHPNAGWQLSRFPNHAHPYEAARGRRPFVAAEQETGTCLDCNHPVRRVSSGGQEWWSHTGHYGAQADDDHMPFPDRYKSAAVRQQATNGVPNPYYFSGGEEGAQGDGPEAFPEDVAQLDPTDERVDWYGSVPPQPRHAASETRENGPPDSDKLLGTEFDSSQERERWNRAEHGEFPGSRDLHAMGSHVFYDPADPTIRTVAIAPAIPAIVRGVTMAAPFLMGGGDDKEQEQHQEQEEQQSSVPDPLGRLAGYHYALDGGAADTVGGTPEIPPSMTPGGPGAVAGEPMTTKPRQIPGGGPAGDPGGVPQPGENPMDPAAPPVVAHRHHGLGQSRDLPSADDPTGLGDEYRERTVEGPLTTRPRQPMEHRNPNTPQAPREPIPTNSSAGAEQEEDEAERREASRIAKRAIRELVGAR